MQYKNSDGFTLLEMLAVLSIMALLLAISFPVYQDYADRARATEIITRYDALRTDLATNLAAGNPIENCSDVNNAISDANLGEDYADLALGFEAVGSAGYRPVLTVCARNDNQGSAAIRVARAALDELSAQHRVEGGAVVTDAVVSFALPLTLGDQPVCRVPTVTNTSACSGSSQPAPSQSPTQATQTAAVTAPTAPQNPPPIVQLATQQPPEVLNALGGVPAAEQQAVADLIDQLDRNQGMLDSLGQALAGGSLSVPGPNFAAAEQACGTGPFERGTDTYPGDCGSDFAGMCLIDTDDAATSCLIVEICSVTCGVTAPASPEVAAALKEKHYQSLRRLCYGSAGGYSFDASNPNCQEVTRLDAERAAGN